MRIPNNLFETKSRSKVVFKFPLRDLQTFYLPHDRKATEKKIYPKKYHYIFFFSNKPILHKNTLITQSIVSVPTDLVEIQVVELNFSSGNKKFNIF